MSNIKGSIIDRNISCSMDIIEEFSIGVNQLFFSAQDILSEGKGILNSINGIVGRIPSEALHSGLLSSISECLTQMSLCNMGMEGYAITGKVKNYVDKMYSTDVRFADLIKEKSALMVGIKNMIIALNSSTVIKGRNTDLINKNGEGYENRIESVKSARYSKSILEKMEYYYNAYNNIPDANARAYYQRMMDQCFNNEIRPILGKCIYSACEKTNDNDYETARMEWENIKDIVRICRYTETYKTCCFDLEGDVNALIIALENENDAKVSTHINNINCMNMELNKLHELSDGYIQWLIEAEGMELMPYICEADNEEAKANQTVTLGIGFTFDGKGGHWDELKTVLGWNEEEIENVIATLYNGKNLDEKYMITEEQARLLLAETQKEYVADVNYAIEIYNNQNETVTFYSQNQLEAMYDYAYNNGLNQEVAAQYSNNEKYIIYYYMRDDQENAVNAVKEYGNNGSRRRLNQMNLFFNAEYDFDDDLEQVRTELGFYEESTK